MLGNEIEIQKIPPFPSRGLVIASANMLKAEGHAGFKAMRLEWDLLDTDAGEGTGLAERATSLATYALGNPELRTPEGTSLQSEIVARAGGIYRSGWMTNIGEKERTAFKRLSSEAGTMNDVSETGTISIAPGNEAYARNFAENSPRPIMSKSNKVFIVHGHDEGALQSLARFLEKLKLEVTILKEQPNQGRTIIEKYEACAEDIGFAVVLLTPDDVGSAAIASNQGQRARQNVIFELGYFAGKLGRGRVCLLRKGDVEIPSDLFGIVYIDMDPAEGWKTALVKELKAAKLEFDPNRMWQ
ncbi:nucleotide-binding protein (plasmid) [Rhizobium tumorigenes]|uniref:Nucleotide-binding protein n=1 Tax=Rhizobium tumorigenes TaxID=2041385 RepID=A0AAF1KWZ8_9HYPH|nr:nucleotide-binding protein [Rhizobium tumorigenes]WFR98469.1 nucleotide-binding protein [Rhizobium tumorigenes]WFS03983.1 nucleotide-binding protein [Rhizobium tumorigenes]